MTSTCTCERYNFGKYFPSRRDKFTEPTCFHFWKAEHVKSRFESQNGRRRGGEIVREARRCSRARRTPGATPAWSFQSTASSKGKSHRRCHRNRILFSCPGFCIDRNSSTTGYAQLYYPGHSLVVM